MSNYFLPNEKYCVSFYVSLADNYQYGSDGIGILFSDTALIWSNNNYIPATPQIQNNSGDIIVDTINWVLITDTFTATGTEKFITIGNFNDDINTQILNVNPSATNQGYSGFFIDDISVTLIRPIYMTSDVYFCVDSVLVGDTIEDFAQYSWSPTNGLACDTCFQSLVAPTITTTYTLTKTTACDTSIAQVTVFVDSIYCDSILNVPELSIPADITLYPNPTNGLFTVLINDSNLLGSEFKVYDAIGKLILVKEINDWKTRINLTSYSNGVYTYQIKKDSETYSGKLVIQ